MSENTRLPRLTPARMLVLYLLFGTLGLVAFDVLLPRVLGRDSLLRRAQFVKGAVEVALTAGLIFLLAWYAQRSLATANRRLERKDEALQVLLRLLRHNVRNDINVIRGHAETARAAAREEDVEDSCSVILETTDGLLHQTETVNRLRDVLDDSAGRVRFDLADVVEEVLAEIRDGHGFEGRLDASGMAPVVVSADPLFPVALQEVVRNAIEHADGSAPTIECSVERDGDVATLRIADDGPGIPEDELAALSSGEESPLSHASGIGLWFVHWIARGSGGDATVRNRPGGGTIVELTLPIADDE